MNSLTVEATFRSGGVTARKFHTADEIGHPWVVLSFNYPTSPSLNLYLIDLEQVTELEGALREAREFLTDEAARDAA